MTADAVPVAPPTIRPADSARIARRAAMAMLMAAGRAEAGRLMRSPLVLAGLVISAGLVWVNRDSAVPLQWWTADIQVGTALLAMAGSALIATQLAAGRERRDAMTELYQSYPAPPAVRTGGLLLGVCGPVLLAVVLVAAAAAWLGSLGAVGSPRPWVFVGGLLLVALGGTVGVALGRWLPHPLTGILVAIIVAVIEIDLVLSFSEPIHLPGGIMWLFPWSQNGWVLTSLPGMTVPYPPPAHLAELAGLIGLACVAALWRLLPRRRIAAIAGVSALALTGWSCWVQAPRVPERTLAIMVAEATQPARYEHCQVSGGVRYCYYPAFASLVRSWAAPVAGVLNRVPSLGGRNLTVRQVVASSFLQYPLVPVSLTSNGTGRTPVAGPLTKFQDALDTNPHLIRETSSPPVYTGLTWARGGPSLGSQQFGLALSIAFWVTGLPTTTAPPVWVRGPGGSASTYSVSCVAAGQAREAIALWLAASATSGAMAGMPATGPGVATKVGKQLIGTDNLPGGGPAWLTVTAQGVALSAEMLRLPARRVESVLTARWPEWLRPAATDAQLARALGVQLPPSQPGTPQQGFGGTVPPPSPVCR